MFGCEKPNAVEKLRLRMIVVKGCDMRAFVALNMFRIRCNEVFPTVIEVIVSCHRYC